ncbi:MAG: hypothetical protein H6807_16125 [Planctomycetes bacterium]|nr:hypothetical protein [Planctomycetota bacterium]
MMAVSDANATVLGQLEAVPHEKSILHYHQAPRPLRFAKKSGLFSPVLPATSAECHRVVEETGRSMSQISRLEGLLKQLASAEGAEAEGLWALALPIIGDLVRAGLRKRRVAADDAEEVVAEVLLSLWQLDGGLVQRLNAMSRSGIARYLRVAGSRGLVRLREKRGQLALDLVPEEVCRPLGRALEPDEADRVLATLDGFRPELRFIMRASMIGYSIAEIHQALGGMLSKGCVYDCREEAYAELRRALAEGDDASPAAGDRSRPD